MSNLPEPNYTLSISPYRSPGSASANIQAKGWVREIMWMWVQRRRQRIALAALDGRLLADVGILPAEAQYEIDKPFWR